MGLRLTARLPAGDRRFALDEGRFVLGSGPEADVRIEQATISRRHAEIEVDDSRARVRDLDSSNGTRLNDQRVDRWIPIEAGDVLELGQARIEVSDLDHADLRPAVSPEADTQSMPGDARPTLATGVLTRFYLSRLRPLVRRLRTDATGFAANLAQAIHDSIDGHVLIERDGAVAASAGEPAESPHCERRQEGWGITAAGFDEDAEPAVRELLAIALELLALQPQVFADDGGASRERSPETAEAPPRPPDPPTGHRGLQEIYRQAARVARGNISVLIEGESGTGKELLAGYLHRASGDQSRALVVLNCASLPRDLLEAELFGIEKGVATGVDARPGKFELADEGTLLLDEIGDMAPETQAKILRVLQEREVYRVGGHSPRPARVRVISATNRSMRDLLDAGDFRLDLYHRIADWTVRLPPLRERRMDIPNLAAHFLQAACREAGKRFGGISEGAVEALNGHGWPGNVRELEREMARCALFLNDGEMLTSEMLQPRIRESAGRESGGGLEAALARAERRAVQDALAACGNNVREAAELLDVGLSTLYRRIKALDIET